MGRLPFLLLGLLPKRFQLFRGRLLCRTTAGAQVLFHPLEPPLELSIGFFQLRLRIELKISRDVHQHKKHVPNFFFQPMPQILRKMRLA